MVGMIQSPAADHRIESPFDVHQREIVLARLGYELARHVGPGVECESIEADPCGHSTEYVAAIDGVTDRGRPCGLGRIEQRATRSGATDLVEDEPVAAGGAEVCAVDVRVRVEA